MTDSYDYIRNGNEILICRCYSSRTDIILPEQIEGCPVTGISDHCFAAEPTMLYRREQVRHASAGQDSSVSSDGAGTCFFRADDPLYTEKADSFCVSTDLTELTVPRTLKSIGNYAFYGCHQLRQISLPSGPVRLGSGVFVDCSRIRRLIFQVSSEDELTPVCMREVLREIEYEVETVITGSQDGRVLCRLIFPGYAEDSVENTPARIIEVHYEGTGFKFRQCFKNGRIDFHQYDSLQYLMSVQENTSTSVLLSLNRLRTPVFLEQSGREKYLDFLRREYQFLADFLLSPRAEDENGYFGYDAVRDLCGAEYFTEEILTLFVELAGDRQMPQIVSLLMDYRRKNFSRKKKTYDF